MVARLKPVQEPAKEDSARPKRNGHYFAGESAPEFIPSGCTVLDCVLGGGWPLGRVANIVGDKAVGKTLIAIEACANLAVKYPKGHIWYREAEAAFDIDYAEQLGLPVDRVDFGPEGIDSSWDTIEDIGEDMVRCANIALKSRQPGLYIIDSLDAVSSRAEMKRKPGEGSYGMEKPKELSKLFREHVRLFRQARMAIIIVSQIRDKIGITFGEKYSRSGGKALDFYASQILWLHHKKTLTSTIKGADRATGVRIRAKCKKNKLAPSFRECEFVLLFGYGTDDLEASLSFLSEVGFLGYVGISKADDVGTYLRRTLKLPPDQLRLRQREVSEAAVRAWQEVEDRFKPTSRKYG